MRIARFADASGAIFLARLEGDTAVPILAEEPGPGRDALRDALAGDVDLTLAPAVAPARALGEVQLRSPVRAPQKILAIGLNYSDHARESGMEPPPAPIAFAKTPNSIIGPGDDICFAKDDSTQVDFEVELAVVIGRRTRRIPRDDALDAVLGYTVCNDVSARDAQFGDGQWVRGKSFDTFCPLGPWIVTADAIGDVSALPVRCRVNGETMQDGNTADMIFDCAEIISYLSRVMTLEPGDVIATGTPFGVGFARTPPVYLAHNDEVEVEVGGIGVLRNTVRLE